MTNPPDQPTRPRWRAWMPEMTRPAGAAQIPGRLLRKLGRYPLPQPKAPQPVDPAPRPPVDAQAAGPLPAATGPDPAIPAAASAAAIVAADAPAAATADPSAPDPGAADPPGPAAPPPGPTHRNRWRRLWFTQPQPPLRLPRPRGWRPPLPLTTVVLLLLVGVPALQLLRLPRPRAVGLEQLLDDVSLLQSFSPNPSRPVPQLWRERLGPAAEALWRRQRGPWWQLWGDHADAAAMLAFSAGALPGGPSAPLPRLGLRVGDLVVVAADPLSRQLLQAQLRPQQRLSRGLQRRCLERLKQEQAVLWNPTGLGVITGPLAPLLQRLSQGCLSVSVGDGGLLWQGEAGAAEGLLAPAITAGEAAITPLPPLPSDRLLEVEGGSIDLLLQGLLSRPLIRDPLASRYGFEGARLELLRRTPFRLRLRPQPQGPFQASLELQLPVGPGSSEPWRKLLEQVARSLQQQGLTPVAPTALGANPTASGAKPTAGGARSTASGARPNGAAGAPAPGRPTTAESPASSGAAAPGGGSPTGAAANAGVGTTPSTAPSAPRVPAIASDGSATWQRADGVVVGGWRWIRPQSPGKGTKSRSDESQLLFFLGPLPTQPVGPIYRTAAERPGAGVLRLRSRPIALQNMGLLPAQVPELVRRSEQLWMVAQPGSNADSNLPLSRLTGGLRVPR